MHYSKLLIEHVNAYIDKNKNIFEFAGDTFILDFDPIKFFELHKKRHLDTARIAVKNTANQLVILTGDGRSWFLNKLRLHYHNIKKSKNLLLKTIKSMDDGEKERFLHYFRIKQIEERLEGL